MSAKFECQNMLSMIGNLCLVSTFLAAAVSTMARGSIKARVILAADAPD